MAGVALHDLLDIGNNYTYNHDINTDHIDAVFMNFVNKLIFLCPEFFEFDTDTALIRNEIKAHGRDTPHLVDYNKYAIAFNKAYFLKNLYKNLITILHLKTHKFISPNLDIFDMGCGAGTSSVAWWLLMNPSDSHFCLNDKCGFQLQLAKQMLSIVGLRHVEFVQAEVDATLKQPDYKGAVFLSYWLCEQDATIRRKASLQFSQICKGGLVVIDYPEHVNDFVDLLPVGSCLETWELISKPGDIVRHLLKEEKVQVYGCYYRPL